MIRIGEHPVGHSGGKGNLAPGATAIADTAFVDAGNQRVWAVIAADAGSTRLNGGRFPARRVSLFFNDDSFDDLNANGLTVFNGAVDWALAGERVAVAFTQIAIVAPPLIPIGGDTPFKVEGSGGPTGCIVALTSHPDTSYSTSDESIEEIVAQSIPITAGWYADPSVARLYSGQTSDQRLKSVCGERCVNAYKLKEDLVSVKAIDTLCTVF